MFLILMIKDSLIMIKKINIILFLCCVAFSDCFALPFEGLYRLDIVHYNDFHARYEETSVEAPTCRFNNNTCIGGFPRLYHEIQTLLAEKPDALLLNAGDSFQGTYWYTLLKWNITKEFMNLLPHDAHAIGNHEFDDSPEGLAPYLAGLKAPVVAANMNTSAEPILEGLYEPSIIVKRKGRKIGIIGLITPETKLLALTGNVEFTDPGEATKREAKILNEKGVDIIIVLSHCGLDVDRQIARDHGEYIDVIIGGHTHSLLWNGVAPSGEIVDGPYPVIVEPTADLKHKVLIVQASAFTKYMGNLSVYFDYKGDYVKWDGGPIFLNRSIEEDKIMKEKLAPIADLIHEAENVYVGETKNDLHFEDCVYGECAIGDMLVDSMNEHAKSQVASPYPYLSFMQRGNIKRSIFAGNITKGIIFELLPFVDRIESFPLRGCDVMTGLERSVTDAWAMDPFKGPWVLQVSGLNVTYDMSKPEGSRAISITIDGKSIEKDQYYQVTIPQYLSNGGDGYTMFKNKINVTIIGKDESLLEAYILRHTPLDITSEGRITILQQNTNQV